MGKLFDYPSYEEARRIVQENDIKSSGIYRSKFKELGLPERPERYYKDRGWIDLDDFLGRKKVTYPTYEGAKRIVQARGIKSQREFFLYKKELELPSNPADYYKNRGWVDWYDFLGRNDEKVTYPTYEEAQRIVQAKGIKKQRDYLLYYKELVLPRNPADYYKDKGWIDWYDFSGRNNEKITYPTYEEAQRIVQAKGVKTEKEYLSYYKELVLPLRPSDYYKDKGWIDWYDFLGKTRKVSSEERKRKILEELFLAPTLLKDDELLQIIYIMAPHLDKKWVEEIQSLFGTTTYEKRLKWVKDQLKGLKEGGITKSKKHGDEDSGRERILEEVEEVMGSEKVKGLLENYYHSVVNRELIKEVDGE